MEKPMTLLEMFKAGMTNKEISDKTSQTRSNISHARCKLIREGKLDKKFKKLILRKDGNTRLRTSLTNTHPKKVVLGTVGQQVLNYLKEGYNKKEICELTNKVDGTISYHINKINSLNLLEKTPGIQMLEEIQQANAFPEACETVVAKYPPDCITGGQKAAYTRSLKRAAKPQKETSLVLKDKVSSKGDLHFIINGISVVVARTSLKNVLIGTDKIVVNF